MYVKLNFPWSGFRNPAGTSRGRQERQPIPNEFQNSPAFDFDLNKFVDLILEEKFTVQPPMRQIFKDISWEDDIDQKLKQANGISEIVGVYTQFFPFNKLQDILRSMDLALLKKKEVVRIMETRGQEFENTANHKKALQIYTLALCFAPEEDEATIVRIYMKRAAIYVRMERFDLAIMDIDMALKYREPKELEVTLFFYRKKASDAMKFQKFRFSEPNINTLIVPKEKEEQEYIHEKYRDDIISRVVRDKWDHYVSVLPPLISVQFHPDKGRYLVTNVDLEPGSTVLVEDPYVRVVEGHLKWQTKRCTYCLKESLNLIPCERCVFCTYCAEDCRTRDYAHGHEFECPLLPFAHAMQLTKVQHLALRGICKAGPTLFADLYARSLVYDDLSLIANTSERSRDNRYFQFSNMASHERPSDMPYIALLAISLAHALRFKTSFFDNIRSSEKSGFEKFIAIAFVNHSKSIPYNTVALTATGIEVQVIATYLEDLDGRRLTQVASGVYPLTDLMNHSCAATTFRQHLPRGRIAIVTNRQLKMGDELSHGYGIDYESTARKDRRNVLARRFGFNCECIACVEDWPILTEMEMFNNSTFICTPCEFHIRDLLTKTHTSEVRDVILKCTLCVARSEEDEPCNPLSLILGAACGLLMRNRPVDAIPLLIECINYFQNRYTQPSLEMIQAQGSLEDSYAIICNRATEPQVIPGPSPQEAPKNNDATNNNKAKRRRFCSIT